MEIQLSCQHATLTPALKQAVQERFERLGHHTNRPTTAHVVLTVDAAAIPPHKAEATLLVNGKPLHASSASGDMYVALDGLVSRLDRRLRKLKTARLSSRAAPSLQPSF